MATNIPPHNFGEVIRSCIALIDEPDITTAQLMDKGIKGPDFPLGGKIVTDRATLRRIYEEGNGSVKVQGEWKVEGEHSKKPQIIITSIPYNVDKGKLENDIGVIIESKKVPQLTGLTNETNEKDGLRIALDIKPGTDAEPGDGLSLPAHRPAAEFRLQHDLPGARRGRRRSSRNSSA